jgi:mRNA interferase RelE/StbE
MYEVVLTEEAHHVYRKAGSPLAGKLNRCFDKLRGNPYSHPNIKRLTGELRGRFRYRIGDWRVVYRVEERSRQVTVLVIAHRGSVYN